jgi:hypothetical protein
VVEGEDSRLVSHCHDFRYGNSTNFRCYQGLVGETVRAFTGEPAADASGDHSAFVPVDVEPVGRMRCRVEGDAQGVGVAGDGVANPSPVVVCEGGAVGREHEPVVGEAPQVPDRSPPRGTPALSVPRRHGEHDLHALAGRNALEGVVD